MNRRVLLVTLMVLSAPYTFARKEAVRAQAPFPEKAFAKAVDAACQRDPRIAGRIPSTKGHL